MKNVGDLITRVREHTFNTGETATSGIPDSHFLNYLNDAQDRLQNLILDEHVRVFETQTTIALVSGLRNYAVPADAVSKNRVLLVEYASDSNANNMHPLRKVTFRELNTSKIDHPNRYALLNGNIYVSPVPNSGTGSIRVTYTKRLDDLDLRRGTISVVTDSGTAITALTLDTSDDDVVALAAGTYLCVNDRDGAAKMRNIRYDSYASATGVVTLTGGSFTYTTGETASAGDFVTVGPYTTTHSKLEDMAERYLVKYAVMEILAQEDSSTDSTQAQQILAGMSADIIAAYEPDGDDLNYIPMLNDYYRT